MPKAYIIEDEPRARKNFINLLESNFPDFSIVGSAGSVKESVEWLTAHPTDADVVFMDVELSDGTCFDILSRVDLQPMVVMTTAYDNYAAKAFEVNSVDYLLKPVSVENLHRAVGRIRERLEAREGKPEQDLAQLARLFQSAVQGGQPQAASYKEKFIVTLNNRIVPVSTRDIAFFYTEAKSTYLVTRQAACHVLDESLDTVEQQLDPQRFFRISRSCIVSESAIESVSKMLGGRMQVSVAEPLKSFTDLTVSRSRAGAFLDWLGK